MDRARRPRPRGPVEAASSEIALRAALDEAHEASFDALAYDEADAELALTLQESLLPPRLLGVHGLDVAARYRSSDDVARVTGGTPDTARPRRALTALARYTVRSLATREPWPSGVLRRLNAAIRERETDNDWLLTAAQLAIRPMRSGSFRGRLSLAGTRRRCAGPPKAPSWRSACPATCCCSTPTGWSRRAGRAAKRRSARSGCTSCTGFYHGTPTRLRSRGAMESAALEHSGGRALDDVAVVVLRVPDTP